MILLDLFVIFLDVEFEWQVRVFDYFSYEFLASLIWVKEVFKSFLVKKRLILRNPLKWIRPHGVMNSSFFEIKTFDDGSFPWHLHFVKSEIHGTVCRGELLSCPIFYSCVITMYVWVKIWGRGRHFDALSSRSCWEIKPLLKYISVTVDGRT